MASVMGAGYYSALTMAIFEDTGFYKADFSKAEVMTWGHNVSCNLLEKNITQWPQMFCNRTEPGLRCTSSRLDVGQSDLVTHTHVLVDYFQHFTNVWLRGSSLYMDYCPVVEANRARTCNQIPGTTWADVRIFNVFTNAARFTDGALAPKNRSTGHGPILGMCSHVQCDNATRTYSIQVYQSSIHMKCTPGQRVTLADVSDAFEAGGSITRPPYVEVCQGSVKAVVDIEADYEANTTSSSPDTHSRRHSSSNSSSTRGTSEGKGSDCRGNGAANLLARPILFSIGSTMATPMLVVLTCA